MLRILVSVLLATLSILSWGPGSIAGSVTLTYALWVSDPVEMAQIEARVRRFEALHPGVEVELLTSAGTTQHRDKLLAMIAGGTAPDLILMSRSHQSEFMSQDFLLPLTRFVESDSDLNWDDVLGHFQVVSGGEIWGLPEHGGGLTFAYNVDLIEQAGLASPYELFRAGEWTMDQYVEMSRRLTRDTNGDGIPEVFGTSHWRTHEWVQAAVSAFGGALFSEDGRRVEFESPKTRDALEWLIELETEYGVAGGDFARGTQAIGSICPRCVFRDQALDSHDFRWNIVPAPRGPAGHKAAGGFNPLVIYRGTPHPELAYELAAFLTSEELQMELVRSRSVFTPTRRSVLLSPEMLDYMGSLNLDVWLLGASEHLAPIPVNVPGNWDNVGLLVRELGQVVTGEKGLVAAIQNAATVVQANLDGAWAKLDQSR